MACVVVVGAQWGDEGKGKVVDLLSQSADWIVRYSGGANAGHTLVVDGQRIVLHLIPSGVLHPGKRCALGDGMVVDLWALREELDGLQKKGLLLQREELSISERAHLLMPYHRALDAAYERRASAIGTTKRGIGPAYEDKHARRGVRVGDLLRPERFRRRLKEAVEEANARLSRLGDPTVDADSMAEEALRLAEPLADRICDVSRQIDSALTRGEHVLLEGAQGTLLDLDHGTYPHVTATTTTAGGASSGVGLGPRAIDFVTAVTKAYTTRVGGGPFPTELPEREAERLRQAGKEFGATTGRPRRCGWLDLAALRLACRVNGIGSFCVTKLDVLAGLDPLQACTGYRLDGRLLDEMPLDPDDLARATPVYESLPGFGALSPDARSLDALPPAARQLCRMISDRTGVPIDLVSVGAGREDSILLRNPFA